MFHSCFSIYQTGIVNGKIKFNQITFLQQIKKRKLAHESPGDCIENLFQIIDKNINSKHYCYWQGDISYGLGKADTFIELRSK